MDDGQTIVGFGILYLLICTVLFHGFSTMDYKITNSQKIKIENAVYTCEKTQELDLK